MRILIRTSKWAIWARRFGSLALPLAFLPVIMHREGLISSADFHVVEITAMAISGLALVLAIGAFVRLWITGDQGWGKAVLGLVFALICLVPFALVIGQALRSPPVSDVTTSYAAPPDLVSAPARPLPPAALRTAVAAAFPNARTRTYPIGPAQTYALVEQLVLEHGWQMRTRREPQTPLATGQVNAVATSLLGWRDEVAIRIRGTAAGSSVDMRSAALHGGPDLGANGRRIEGFLAALDERVTLALREVPTAAPPEIEPDGNGSD